MNKILVIEDEYQIRTNLEEVLQLEGYSIITAMDGRSGVALAQQENPDLIICDVNMPEIDGFEAIARLRQDPTTMQIPVIFLTAKAERADLRQGMELGADDYITKPFQINELLRAVEIQLKKRKNLTQYCLKQFEELETQLNYLALHDTLTGLPNKLALEDKFNQSRKQIKHQQLILPLLLIDLDPIYTVKLFFGQTLKHLVLKTVAALWQSEDSEVSQSIQLISCLKGDLLAVLLTPTSTTAEITHIVQKLLNTLSHPLIIENQQVLVETKIGIACYSGRGSELDFLIDCAELALSKQDKKAHNIYRFYSEDIHQEVNRKLEIEADLYKGLVNNSFQVYYQPKVDIRTKELIGAESLIRWQHPEKGWISPAEFIPIAETTGLIIPLGEFVLMKVCEQILAWNLDDSQRFRISVNLSVHQLIQEDAIDKLINIIKKSGIQPRFLEFELTESAFIEDIPGVLDKLIKLRSLGICLSIDDFGTGYSSLNYLHSLPIDTLKIDRCFIHQIDQYPQKQIVSKTIIRLAQEMKLQIIAEGVETQTELDWLRQHECHFIQGYCFSPPLCTQEFENLLVANHLC